MNIRYNEQRYHPTQYLLVLCSPRQQLNILCYKLLSIGPKDVWFLKQTGFLTSTVISSSNEGNNFFSQSIKNTKCKKHIGKRKFVFLTNNLLNYQGWDVICVNIVCFPNHRQKSNWKKWKFAKNTFQKISLFSIILQLFAKLLSHSSNTVYHN